MPSNGRLNLSDLVRHAASGQASRRPAPEVVQSLDERTRP
jgi:hypothetical protein